MNTQLTLAEDLQSPKSELEQFAAVTERTLRHLTEIVSERVEAREYTLLSSTIAGTTKRARPVKRELFILDGEEFRRCFTQMCAILEQVPHQREPRDQDYSVVDRVVYTMQQTIGVGLDFLGESNSARKHVGNRFEELIRAIFDAIGITHKKIVFKIPYTAEEGEGRTYSCETDMILSAAEGVESTPQHMAEEEIVVSLKTSSKDRMGKIFLDKILMSRFAGRPVKVVGIFHNDVQRKSDTGVAFTFVSGLFMVYTRFLETLEGVYFVDPPPKALRPPFSGHIRRFSHFVLRDVWQLLTPP